jgi:osmotically-inducible protein OsmY
MTMKNSAIKWCVTVVCVASLGSLLSACVPLVVGGAAVGGALVATDRRTSGAQLEDEGIELRSIGRINENLGSRVHVNVTSYNRQVLLSGEVPSAQDKQLVEQIVSRVDNVRSVVNELAVLGASSLTQRSSDALITGKVKAAMVDSKDLFANSFKVVTERGIVYLMGRVTQREADRATEISRSTGGVQKVVRLLEIISEEELQRTLPAAPKS